MKNIWLHSLCVVVFGSLALALANGALAMAVAQGMPALLDAPAHALALLGPGLLAGWFTRRHPLLVGAAAGVLFAGAGMAGVMPMAGATSAGEVVAIGMVIAVAALAGRALRYRFRPGEAGPRPAPSATATTP